MVDAFDGGEGGGGPGEGAPDGPLVQLRRRYDELRADYESLLTRLRDLESGAPIAAPAAPALRFGLLESLLAPLEQLRQEYIETLASLEDVVGGLETVVSRGLKGQRGAPSASPPPTTPETVESARLVRLEVRGRNAGELLAFRERLAALPGVRAVTIHAVDQERATLVVELGP